MEIARGCDAGELRDRRIVGQTVEPIALQQVCNALIQLRFLIEKGQGRIVALQFRLAFHREADVDKVGLESLVAQMQPEFVSDTIVIHADGG